LSIFQKPSLEERDGLRPQIFSLKRLKLGFSKTES
jgi:hypothetical protein